MIWYSVPVFIILASAGAGIVIYSHGKSYLRSLTFAAAWGCAVWLPMFFIEMVVKVVFMQLIAAPQAAHVALMAAVVAMMMSALKFMAMYANTWNKRDFSSVSDGAALGFAIALGYSFADTLVMLVSGQNEAAAVYAIYNIPVQSAACVFAGMLYAGAKFIKSDIPRRLVCALSITAGGAIYGVFYFFYAAAYTVPALAWGGEYIFPYVATVFGVAVAGALCSAVVKNRRKNESE